MARALDDDEAWEDDFQTPHTPARYIVRWDGGSHGELAVERLEASRGSPAWQSFFQVDNGKEPETLEDINPHWRAMRWLQVAVQGIAQVQVGHPTNIGGGGRSSVTGQASSRSVVVEHQGAWGGRLPTCSDHPQYWSVYYR